MPNPNLIRKSIVDKNGKATTVHISMGKLDPSQDTSQPRIHAASTPPQLSSAPGVYQFSVAVSRNDYNVYLPRKKNPRGVFYKDHIIIDVPVVDVEEAPISMSYDDVDYRHFDGNIYKLERDGNGIVIEAEDMFSGSYSLEHFDRYAEDTPDYQGVFNEHADDFIVIDGEVYKKTSEPKYVIDVSHHMWGDTMKIGVSDSMYDSRISNENNFSALEYDQAVAKASEIIDGMTAAYNSGRNSDSDWNIKAARQSLDELEKIEVSDPAGVGTTYEFPVRIEYPEFHSYDSNDWNSDNDHNAGERFTRAMTAYRDIIQSTPGAITETEAGAKKIEWSRLPDGLKNNYQSALSWASDHDYLV
jgi:hypothetical protein